MGDNRQSSEVVTVDSIVDPELVALPRPPRQERTLSLVLMTVTGLLAVIMAVALAGDVKYALVGGEPANVGALAGFRPDAALSNSFVRGTGILVAEKGVRYGRPLESDTFQLSPVVNNDHLWVELRIPVDAPNVATPPVTFVGRLLPMRHIAFGFGGLRRSLGAGSSVLPADAWIVVDGATPVSSQWSIALVGLLAIFAAYNLVTIARILRPVRA